MRQAAIVEDNPEEAQSLNNYLERFCQDHGERFSATFFPNADGFLESRQPFDLVFMDIEMPGINGLQAAAEFRKNDLDTPLVLVTNLAQYALRGYEVDAFGFLVKPVAYDGFERTMEKVCRILGYKSMKTLRIPTRHGMHALRISSLSHIEVFNHDLVYHSTDFDDDLVVRGSLKEVEETLADAAFVRISSSCLVNMDHIMRVKGNQLDLADGTTLYFSRPRKKQACEEIANYLAGDER